MELTIDFFRFREREDFIAFSPASFRRDAIAAGCECQSLSLGVTSQYHLRERVGQTSNARLDQSTHPLTQVVLTSSLRN